MCEWVIILVKWYSYRRGLWIGCENLGFLKVYLRSVDDYQGWNRGAAHSEKGVMRFYVFKIELNNTHVRKG